MKKDFLWSLLSVIMMATISLGFSSCGSDDDDGVGGNAVDVSSLIGKQYFMQEDEIVSIRNYEVGFLSPYFCYVHKWGRDLDAGSGWDKWDHGVKELLYYVSGNKIVIPYEHDGIEIEIVMTFVNSQLEGWECEGPVDRTWKVSTKQFDAKSGTQEMFGYYSQDNLRLFAEQEANEKVAYGNTTKKYWEEGFFPNPTGGSLHIVDGNTIDNVDEIIDIKGPKNEPAYIYQTQQYNPKSNNRSVTYTLYYYFMTDYYVSRHKYVMDGNTLVVSNGKRYIYENGTLRDEENNPMTGNTVASFTKF